MLNQWLVYLWTALAYWVHSGCKGHGSWDVGNVSLRNYLSGARDTVKKERLPSQ